MTNEHAPNKGPFIFTLMLTMGLAAACGSTVTVFENDETDGTGGTGATTAVGPTTGVGPNMAVGPSTGVGPNTGPSMGGICNSGLTAGTDGEDACLTASCCTQFNACMNDSACQGCLTNAQAPGCASNTLLDNFDTCSSNNCPTNVCDAGLTFTDSSGDPAFACIACASDPTNGCCGHLATCVGDGSTAGVNNCLTCLSDPSVDSPTPSAPTSGACFNLGATVYNAAVAFQTCLNGNCPSECGF